VQVGEARVEDVERVLDERVQLGAGAAGQPGARVIPESREPGAERTLDLLGLTTSIAALTSLTYALLRANELGWGSPAIVALLAVAVAALIAFVVVGRAPPEPPRSPLRSRPLRPSDAAASQARRAVAAARSTTAAIVRPADSSTAGS
jgi:hypothetical protein